MNELTIKIKKIFSISSDSTDDITDAYTDEFEKLINEYGWTNVFAESYSYLINECKDSTSVRNFASLFWTYGGQDHVIPNPVDFVSYFYFRIGITSSKEVDTLIDSIASTVLQNANVKSSSELYDYIPIHDSLIQNGIKMWKERLE